MKNKPSIKDELNKPARTLTIVLWVLHGIYCLGLALFVLLGGAGLSALLASRGFRAIAIGMLAVSIGGYWYFRQKNSSSCITSYSEKEINQQ
jgi:hypothetical protein